MLKADGDKMVNHFTVKDGKETKVYQKKIPNPGQPLKIQKNHLR